jgi:hypothetical protein
MPFRRSEAPQAGNHSDRSRLFPPAPRFRSTASDRVARTQANRRIRAEKNPDRAASGDACSTHQEGCKSALPREDPACPMQTPAEPLPQAHDSLPYPKQPHLRQPRQAHPALQPYPTPPATPQSVLICRSRPDNSPGHWKTQAARSARYAGTTTQRMHRSTGLQQKKAKPLASRHLPYFSTNRSCAQTNRTSPDADIQAELMYASPMKPDRQIAACFGTSFRSSR